MLAQGLVKHRIEHRRPLAKSMRPGGGDKDQLCLGQFRRPPDTYRQVFTREPRHHLIEKHDVHKGIPRCQARSSSASAANPSSAVATFHAVGAKLTTEDP